MKILIVGLGSIGKKHVSAIRKIYSNAEIYALRSSPLADEPERIINLYDWNEAPANIDFIIISNPSQYHKDAILNGLKLNCPLFIEKPVLTNMDDALEIIDKLNVGNPLTYIACNLRFHPCLQFLHNYLKGSLKINEVNIYCGSNLAEWRPGQDYRTSYSARADLGGGVHLDLIHELDYCYWLFGKPEKTISLKRKVSDLDIDSFDFAAYHLNYANFTSNIILNYYRKIPRRMIEICHTEGIIQADLLECSVSLNDKIIFKDKMFTMADTYKAQMNYFIQHISSREPMMNDFAEAVEVLKIAVS
jgi:predicted dehydrogenase